MSHLFLLLKLTLRKLRLNNGQSFILNFKYPTVGNVALKVTAQGCDFSMFT